MQHNGPSSRLDTGYPHAARVYDYLLGGKDNFAADRDAAEKLIAAGLPARTSAVENRKFMRRAVEWLAKQGVRQFLDIGTGLPTSPNMHQIAQGVAPTSRVVYVDNDPLVLAHARALLTSGPEGVTAYVEADVRDTGKILADAAGVLDFGKPVALSVIALLHLLDDADDPYGVVSRLVAPLVPGSYVVLSHGTNDPLSPEQVARFEGLIAATGQTYVARTHKQVARFFDGLELVDPGVVLVSRWKPEPGAQFPADADVGYYGGVARKR